ncbi:MAG: YceD family protein [Pseudomonadota bacterium]
MLVDEYPRLSQEIPALGDGEVVLQFTMDERNRPGVEASIELECSLTCQWCLEPQVRKVSFNFATLLAVDELQAREWEASTDPKQPAIAVVGEELDVAALVEDELLLQLPGSVCVDENCSSRPSAEYSDNGKMDRSADYEEDNRATNNPFAVLADLKLDR